MKKSLLCLLIIVCLISITSCATADQSWKFKNYFANDVLEYGDIKDLVKHIQKTVKEKFDVALECEIEFVE